MTPWFFLAFWVGRWFEPTHRGMYFRLVSAHYDNIVKEGGTACSKYPQIHQRFSLKFSRSHGYVSTVAEHSFERMRIVRLCRVIRTFRVICLLKGLLFCKLCYKATNECLNIFFTIGSKLCFCLIRLPFFASIINSFEFLAIHR